MTAFVDEDALAEQPAIDLLKQLGYGHVHGDALEPGCADRQTQRDVVLVERLRAAIKKLNPWINDTNLAWAVHRLTQVQATDLMEANQKVHADLVQSLSREQEVKGKKGFQTIRIIDWERPEANDFLVVNQLRVKGDDDRRPDAIIYVNGLPLAVIECKSPSRPGPKDEGVKQLRVYQSSIPRLFWCAHFLVVAAGSQGAWYGSIGSPGEFFFDWRDPWPTSRDEVEQLIGRAATPQDLLLTNLFEKRRFLDHLRNFVVFEREGNKTIKKLPRYQQFRAVNKATERVRQGKGPRDRSGVVWHTQGSGKSLTMLWLALKLRRDPLNENPTLVIVTDRNDLDRQISKTFSDCGYTVHRARSVKDLHARLKEPRGITLTTTIQKFLPERRGKKADEEEEVGLDTGVERDASPIPLLSDASNIFVLVDEAHRTQYRSLAANMRTALPNATFLGFTGTPIDKKDRKTHQTFGSYIDTYTIQQAVSDEATVPIFYEGRLPELRVEGANSIDELFDRFFANRSDKERAEIKKRYVTMEAVACAPDRINKIAYDIVQHFECAIAPGKFKGQIVAVNREAAVLYKERLDALNGPSAAVVISANHKDEDPKIKAWHRTKEQHAEIIKDFKETENPKILIVCDMLLTGFDAPVEQVMYLDSGLKEHNLLQAIARVNRRHGPDKSYGLIVDYWGVSEFLEEALAIFKDTDIKGALTPRRDELPRFEALHARALGYFRTVKHKNGVFSDRTEANDIVERCVQVMEPDDLRAEFRAVFRALSQCYDRLMPDPKLNSYRDAFKLLGLVVKGSQRYDRDKFNLDGCSEKVRQLIAESVRALNIEVLVDPVPILAADFDGHVDRLRSPEAKASEMEHAIRHEIRIKLEEDPVFYVSMREKLETIIKEKKEERLSQRELFDRLRGLIADVRGRAQMAQAQGMSEHEFAVYGLVRGSMDGEVSSKHRTLAKEIVELLAERAVIDWEGKPSVLKDMRRDLKRLLRVADLWADGEIDAVTTKLVDLAKTKLKTKA